MAYATLTDLKAYLGIDPDDTGSDALLQDFLERASQAVDTMTGRRFVAQTETHAYGSDAYDAEVLWLDDDLYSLSQVVNGDGEEIPVSEIKKIPRKRPYRGLELRATASHVWDFETGDVQVTGLWGFSTEPPADIVQATVRLAAYMYRQRDSGFEVVRFGDGSIRVPSGTPQDVLDIVQLYRRRV